MIEHLPQGVYAPILEEALSALVANDTRLWSACYPRRIVSPSGFFNPKWYGLSTYASQSVWFMPGLDMLPHTTLLCHTSMLINRGVPTYFVDREFAEAVLATEPPEGFRFADLRMPLDSMLFSLPVDFVYDTFGWFTPFIGVSRVAPGTYPHKLGKLPECDFDWTRAQPVKVEGEMILMHYPRFKVHDLPCDYTGTYPVSRLVSDIASSLMTDATVYERRMAGLPIAAVMADSDADKLEAKEEQEVTQRLAMFTTKLLLVLTAAPSHMHEGGLERAAKHKHGRLKHEALWAPSLVKFARKLVPKVPVAGEVGLADRLSRSPRMHWRKGHMTHVVFGPKEEQLHLNALPQKLDGKVDWAHLPKDMLDQFWKCHRLQWVEPTLVNKD